MPKQSLPLEKLLNYSSRDFLAEFKKASCPIIRLKTSRALVLSTSKVSESDLASLSENGANLKLAVSDSDEDHRQREHLVFEWDAYGISGCEELVAEIGGGRSSAIFLWPYQMTSVKTIRNLANVGIRRFYFWEGTAWRSKGAYGCLADKVAKGLLKRILNPKHTLSNGIDQVLGSAQLKGKIILYAHQCDSRGSFGELCRLAVALKSRGADCRVWTQHEPRHEGVQYANYLSRNRVKFKSLAGAGKGVSLQWAPVKALEKNLLKFRPDILHAWPETGHVAAGFAGLQAGVPLILLSSSAEITHGLKSGNGIPWSKNCYQFFSFSRKIFIVHKTEAGAQEFSETLKWPLDRCHVMGPSIDVEGIAHPNRMQRDSLRSEVGCPKEGDIICGVFRMSSKKRPFLFVDVLRSLNEKRNPVHAIIAGEGPLLGGLRRYVRETGLEHLIHLVGWRPDVPVILGSADVLLSLDPEGGSTQSLLEAQYLGCVPVVVRGGEVERLVLPDRTGLVCDGQEPDQIAARILPLLEDSKLKSQLASAGKKHVEENFDMGQSVKQIVSLYRRGMAGQLAPAGLDYMD